MSSPESLALKRAHKVVGHHGELDRVYIWLSEDNNRLPQLIDEFDAAVETFNSMTLGELPEWFTNARMLKVLLGSRTLPTLRSLMVGQDQKGVRERLRQWDKVLFRVDGMMMRGEMTKTEPYLTYQTTQTDLEALAVGSVIHFGEEAILELSHHLPEGGLSEKIEMALEEILSLNPRSLMWQAVVGEDRLNWVKNWPGFSVEFRNRFGLS